MEDKGLPSIKDMYNCTRQNFDYNVIRVYESRHKQNAIPQKPTKKSHYLNDLIRLNCSPGPANSGNHQSVWYKKSPFQCRRAEKKTYLDQIYNKEKKSGSPSPNHYAIKEQWPKKKDQVKAISQKINFADTCQYESDKIPGPGNYNLRTYIGTIKKDDGKKIQPHQPIKPKQFISAEVATYSPCPLDYNTFTRYSLMKNASQTNFQKKLSKPVGDKSSKENVSPGPAAYSTVSFWPGKSPPKNKEINLFRYISKGPTFGVYH